MMWTEVDAEITKSERLGSGPVWCASSRIAVLLVFALGFLFPSLGRGQQAQTIAFTQPPPAQAYAGTSVALTATATSGLPVLFSVASGPGQVSGTDGSTLTFTGVGTVVVQADQAGGSGFSAATPVQASTNATLLTEPVTTSSATVSTLVTFTADGTLAQISALTQGAVNLDFSVAGVATAPGLSPCVAGVTYTSGQTCSLQFTFKPTRPGIRYGGLTLADAAGNLLANSYVYGYGVGPQVLYQPIVQSQVGSSLGQPSGVAINGYGDLFVSNYNNLGTSSALVEIAANGTVTPIGPFNSASGKDVAVDGSGNVFLLTRDTLFEVVAVNGTIPATPVTRTLATGFTVDGGGLAVDGSGNAYVANGPADSTLAQPSGLVYAVYAVGGVIPENSAKQIIGPVFDSPTGVAVDSSGNVYVSDEHAPGIFEMLAVNGRVPASPVVVKLGVGSVAPSNVRLDNTNDIFITDAYLPGVLEYTAVNGVVDPATQPKSLGSDFILPAGLLVEGSGNVYVADEGYPEVIKLNFSDVPALNFAPTIVGETSTDSPRAVTYTNAGNADLLFTPPLIGSNPAITPGFTLSTSSTCPQLTPGSAVATLGVGQSCTNQVSFTPTVKGPRAGTLTTVDNDLSVPNATQIVHLNGTGTLKVPTIQFSVGDHFVDDPPFTLTATSDSPAPINYSVQSGPASIVGSTVTLAGTPGEVTLVATQAETDPYDAGSATAIFNVSKHGQTISFAQPATPVLIAASPLPLSATASSGLPVTFSVVSGPGTVSGNTLRLTGYGTIVIAADQAGNAIYDPAARVTRQLVVLDENVVVSVTGTPNPVFLKNAITFKGSVVPLDNLSVLGSIIFMDGSTPLATLPLNGCCASFTTSTLTLGQHKITTVYSGNDIYAEKTSSVLNVLVEDFALTVRSPDVTISHGGTAVYNLDVTTVGGTVTAAPIQFTVTGNPDHSPLVFSPPQVDTGSGATHITMTIQTQDYPVGPFAQVSKKGITLAALSLGVFCGLLRKRRRFRSLLMILLLVAGLPVLAMFSGCSNGWGAQPYSMTVTAISGALSHSAAAHLVSR